MINFWQNLTWQQKALAIETALLVIIIALFFLRNRQFIKDIVKWIRPSAEGENRTASGRRLTAFAISITYILSTFAFYYYAFSRSAEHLIGPGIFLGKFALDILFVGLLWGFINQQTLVALKNGGGLSNFITGANQTNNSKTTNIEQEEEVTRQRITTITKNDTDDTQE